MILFIIISKVSLYAWCKIVNTLAGVWHFGTFQGTALYMPDGILYITKIVIKQFVVLFVFLYEKERKKKHFRKEKQDATLHYCSCTFRNLSCCFLCFVGII